MTSRIRYARQKDRNHKQVAQVLELHGATVMDTSHAGRGVPDLLVVLYGFTIAVELKDGTLSPSERALTEAEEAWREKWVRGGGEYRVIESIEHALRMVKQFQALAWGTGR